MYKWASARAFCLAFLLAGISFAQQYVISTLAGGAAPATPGPGLTVSIGSPTGMATDTAGNAYFTSLNCVFKLDLKGVVTRLAGTSRLGYSGDGGAATSAQLSGPNGVAVDASGNIFIADTGNNRVREISNGIITTVAGDGTSATLYNPTGVAVDTQGNIFIADTNNNRVQKVSSGGVVTTIATQLAQPQYVAVDGSGNLIVADTGNNRVIKVSTTGFISTVASSAQLSQPEGVAVDSQGNIFIADAANYRVRQVSNSGVITTVAGTGSNGATGDGGPAINASINGLNGIAVDASGNLFLASYYSFAIREVSSAGIITTVAGTGDFYSGDNGAAQYAQIASPDGIAADSAGNVFVVSDSRVRKISANGLVTTVAGNGLCCGGTTGGIPATSTAVSAERVAVDGSGNLYISDFFNLVHKVSASGILTTVAGTGTSGFSGDGGPATSAQLANPPGGVAIDTAGNLYIADTNNNRIRKVSATGTITTVAGNGTAGFAGDLGLATAAELSQPQGVAVDASGNLYIADSGNNRIRKVSGGVITTLAGTGSGDFAGDGGPAASAHLQNPQGVAVDGQGNLFIADTSNNRVRQVAGSGIITTAAGQGGFGYSGDCGAATNAQLAFPRDLAVDSSGHVFISDSNNNAVRRLQPTTQPTLLCAVADAASEAVSPVSPGKIVVIYGTGLGPSSIDIAAPVSGVFGSQAGGTTVSVNGFPAPLIYTLAGQVSAIVPYEVTGSIAQFSVSYQGQTSALAVPIAASAPSIFTANGSGVGQAAAVNNADGTLNAAANPVGVGQYIQLYATGDGQLSPVGADGSLAPTKLPLPAPLLQVQATVGGLPATIAYAGATPGAVLGLLQVDVLIPAGVQPGSQVPVVIQVGTATSAAGVWIAVSGH